MSHTKHSSRSHLRNSKPFFGFTLVELIVVITILAILATIAFLSFSGYSSTARDGTRLSDTANLSKIIELAGVQSGSYPQPDAAFTVTYSGGIVWYQGVAGSDLVRKANALSKTNISPAPVDPLLGTPYTYSVIAV